MITALFLSALFLYLSQLFSDATWLAFLFNAASVVCYWVASAKHYNLLGRIEKLEKAVQSDGKVRRH